MLKFTDFLFIVVFLLVSAWLFFVYIVPHLIR